MPGLSHLDTGLMKGLAKHVKMQRLPMEALVVEQGRKLDAFFVLLEGTVSIHNPIRGERRCAVQYGNAGLSSTLGTCIRRGVPGEEPFGLTSMIFSIENLYTVACSSDCLFFVLKRNDLDAELYQKFHSACRQKVDRPEYMQRPSEERMDHHFLNNINYLQENPFFCSLNIAAQQSLANTIQVLRFTQGESVTSTATRTNLQLAVVNRGYVSSLTSSADSEKIKAIRQLPLFQDLLRGINAGVHGVKRGGDEMGYGGVSGGGIGRVASSSGGGFGRVPSSAGSLSRSTSSANMICRMPSAALSMTRLSRAPSQGRARGRWGSAISALSSTSGSAPDGAQELVGNAARL